MALTWSEPFTSLATIGTPGVSDPQAVWMPQAKDASRITLVNGGGVMLTTQPGDTDIAGSGTMERCDLCRCHSGTADPDVYGNGTSQWWAHNIIFPGAYQFPNGEATNVFDFHHTGKVGSASFSVAFGNEDYIQKPMGIVI